MILLKEYESEIDAKSLAERLRAKGIFTHVSSRQSKRIGAFATGALKVGVWSVLDHQATDAIALLSNNRHQVENPLTEEEMVELETKIDSPGGALYNAAILTLSVMALALVGAYALFK
ncbi:hypothetical protein [Shewanella insulae]|uniref:hypothetical protein n=1 Tax=Shewanella insulae TaxID=2681496 RepID=UPI00247FE17A|nr:hypothetical protein [Shewanella insulae]